VHIIGLDPGPTHTGYAIVREDYSIYQADKVLNDDIITLLYRHEQMYDPPLYLKGVVIEDIIPYANKYKSKVSFGKSLIETCKWMGEFRHIADYSDISCYFYTRPQWGTSIVGNKACNDKAVAKALEVRFGGYEKGQPLELLTNTDKRSAFGVAVYHLDLIEEYNLLGE